MGKIRICDSADNRLPLLGPGTVAVFFFGDGARGGE
jgi:hypothetical protein